MSLSDSGTRLSPAVLPLVALAACTTGPKDYLEYRSRADPTSVVRQIAGNAEACWFKSGAPGFEGLVYTTERNAGVSRLLLVAEDAPEGLPKLVVSAHQDGRHTSIRLFGPLLATGAGARIQVDVDRWAGGGSGCG